MSGVNKAIIVGRLGKDPELRQIGQGQSVCTLAVATSENWLDKSGQKQERTEWHRIVLWGKQAETAGKYLQKGRMVYIEGRLQTRSWEDQQGQKKYSTEIIASTMQFLSPNPNATAGAGASSGGNYSGGLNSEPAGFSDNDFGPEPTFDSKEELPF